MKTSSVVTLATLLLVSAVTLAQEKDKPALAGPDSRSAASARPLTVLGKVSNDGKTFTTDIDSEWVVSNAEALKGQEGRRVMVKCYVDTEKNRIQVLLVKREESESNSIARYTDSAFRR